MPASSFYHCQEAPTCLAESLLPVPGPPQYIANPMELKSVFTFHFFAKGLKVILSGPCLKEKEYVHVSRRNRTFGGFWYA